jgi:hypothetical protein
VKHDDARDPGTVGPPKFDSALESAIFRRTAELYKAAAPIGGALDQTLWTECAAKARAEVGGT